MFGVRWRYFLYSDSDVRKDARVNCCVGITYLTSAARTCQSGRQTARLIIRNIDILELTHIVEAFACTRRARAPRGCVRLRRRRRIALDK